MPSFESCFKEFSKTPLPKALYVDTSFFVNALVKGQRYHTESIGFIEQLTKHQPIIIFSELLISELRCAILSICTRNSFGTKVRAGKKLSHNPELIREYCPEVQRQEKNFYDILQRFKDWASVPLSPEISKNAQKIICKYRVGSYDAIHIATMESWELKDIVVFDKGVENLPRYKGNCYIWTVNGWQRYQKRQKITSVK